MKAPTLIGLVDKWRSRKHNYRSAFGNGAPAQKALIDLGKFCHAYEANVTSHDASLVAVGLRRAYFYIIDHLQFEPDELLELYKVTKRAGDE